MKALVAGWFSFEGMGASAGDIIARDVVCEWLNHLDVPYEIALAAPFLGGVAWENENPSDYTHLVFVCGPLGNGPPVNALLESFQGTRMIGINLTMLHDLDEWNPFDLLIERDSSRASNPDLAFGADTSPVPVVALTLIDNQPEYGARDRREDANRLIYELLDSVEAAVVPVNTRLDIGGSLRSAAEVEAVIAASDVVISTRLHGLVLGLKNGIPVLAIDSVSGGDKVSKQAEAIGWPICLKIDGVTPADVSSAFRSCLEEQARTDAQRVARKARTAARGLQATFSAGFVEQSSDHP